MKSGTWVAAIGVAAVLALGIVIYKSQPSPPRAAPPAAAGAGQAKAVLPRLSVEAVKGQEIFQANCAVCHGGSGTGKGPPLVHRTYAPNHHGDIAFQRAVKFGVRQHHWPFGNMPAQPQVSEQETALIVRYVRELQKANGIF